MAKSSTNNEDMNKEILIEIKSSMNKITSAIRVANEGAKAIKKTSHQANDIAKFVPGPYGKMASGALGGMGRVAGLVGQLTDHLIDNENIVKEYRKG